MNQSFSNVKTTKTTALKLLDIAGVASIVAGMLLLIVFWRDMPDSVPIHFNIQGEPDGWGSKYSLIMVPIIAIGLFALCTVLEDKTKFYNIPFKITEDNAQIQYQLARSMINVTKNLSTILLMVISCYSIFQADGAQGRGLTVCISIIVGILILSIVVYFIKAFKHK